MSLRTLKAKHLFLGDGKKIHNGYLTLNEENKIVEIGEADVLDQADQFDGLCPGFVNTHCHLELSHMYEKVPMHTGIEGFIPSLQSQRDSSIEEIKRSISSWDHKMEEEGIIAVGDITNSDHSLECKERSNLRYHSFIELFGLREHKADEIRNKGTELRKQFLDAGLSASLSPHSPYSVSSKLFQQIRTSEKAGPISIHNQESRAEMELFEERSGPLKDMLLNFGNAEESLPSASSSSLAYALQFISSEQKILLVHNTFTEEVDIENALETHDQLYWCFCPNANLFIEKKLPNIPLFASKGLKCTLGTDSLASNHQLSILEEMKTIQLHFPELRTELLMKWACKNGSEFLGIPSSILEVGRKCQIVEIENLKRDGSFLEESRVARIIQ